MQINARPPMTPTTIGPTLLLLLLPLPRVAMAGVGIVGIELDEGLTLNDGLTLNEGPGVVSCKILPAMKVENLGTGLEIVLRVETETGVVGVLLTRIA